MEHKETGTRYWDFNWRLGPMRAVEIPSPEGHWALSRLEFIDQRHALAPSSDWVALARPDRLFESTLEQLDEYASGRRHAFDLPLAPQGTPFQQAVWRQIAGIAFGAHLSYGAIATAVARPKASRAVGAATGRNPIGIIVPCHRVIGSQGALTGYAGGLPRKIAMLAFERGESTSLLMTGIAV